MNRELNNVSHKNTKKRITDIKLLELNPRYTDLLSIDWNKIKEDGNRENQIKIAANLLRYEDDFANFKTLLKSIARGYDNDADTIICLTTKIGDFVVVEGNRRILASKMLSDLDFAKDVINAYKNMGKINGEEYLYDSEDIDKDEDPLEFLEAAENVFKLISNLHKDDKVKVSNTDYILVQLFLYKEEDFSEEEERKIRESILSRSVSAPGGKLGWPRYQTLKNTYDIFSVQKGDLGDRVIATADFLNRPEKSVHKELVNATFIFILQKYYNSSYKIDWKRLKTSAIELSLNLIDTSSFSQYKDLKEFLDIYWKIGDKDFSFGENKNKNTSEISNFLIDNFEIHKSYSTRGWKKNKSKKRLYEFLGLEFSEDNFKVKLESGNSDEKAQIEKIIETSKKFRHLYSNVSKKVPKDYEDISVYLNEDEPEFILRLYLKRLMQQEIQLLSNNIEEKDKFTYPYYSFVSIGRSSFELLLVYIFVRQEKFRADLLDKGSKNTGVNKKYVDYVKPLSDSDLVRKVYHLFGRDEEKDMHNYTTSHIKKYIAHLKENGRFENDFINLLRSDIIFADKVNSIINAFDAYNNELFNRTVHRPYWLLSKGNLNIITEITSSSIIILQSLLEVLNINTQ